MNDKKKIETVGIAYNLKPEGVISDYWEEYDEPQTIESLKQEILAWGFQVTLFEQDDKFTCRIAQERPDFVLNIAEGIGSSRCRESQVPCILESLKIPYTGSDPISIGITLDKYLTNHILKAAYVPVPQLYMIKKDNEIDLLQQTLKKKRYWIVKPRWEGSSKGIFLNSVTDNIKELKERVNYILITLNQPAVLEEFLEKEEITAGVCGNSNPYILGMMKILPRQPADKPFVYSIETKRDWQAKVVYQPQDFIPQLIRSQVQNYALKAFSALELRDIARIDFRVDSQGIPKIIDINPLPGLSPVYSDLPILWKLQGREYSELISAILQESFNRHGFCQGYLKTSYRESRF